VNTTYAPALHDVGDDLLVVHVVEREVLFADHGATSAATTSWTFWLRVFGQMSRSRKRKVAGFAPSLTHQARVKTAAIARRHGAVQKISG